MGSDGLVPDDFDLEDALHAHSTTPEEEQARCPECGSIKVTPYSPGKGVESPADYRCDYCDARLDEADLVGGETRVD